MFKIEDLNLAFTKKPHSGLMFVLPLAQATRLFGGLIQGAEDRELPQSGIVLKLGEPKIGTETGHVIPIESKVGELIEFGKYAGIATNLVLPNGPLRVFIMRDSEVLSREDAFELEFHEDRDLRHIHEKGLTCEHCPKSALIEEERARLRAEREAAAAGAEVQEAAPTSGPALVSER